MDSKPPINPAPPNDPNEPNPGDPGPPIVEPHQASDPYANPRIPEQDDEAHGV